MVKRIRKKEIDLFILSGQDDGFDPVGWNGFPECHQVGNEAPFVVAVHIPDKDTLFKFADLIGNDNLKNETKLQTKSIWYPSLILGERGSNIRHVWMEECDIKFGATDVGK